MSFTFPEDTNFKVGAVRQAPGSNNFFLPIVIFGTDGITPLYTNTNPGYVQVNGSNAIYAGTLNVTTTAVVLGSQTCSEVLIQSDPSNTQNILVGSASNQTIVISPAAAETIPCANINLVYVIASSGTAKVNWLARS